MSAPRLMRHSEISSDFTYADRVSQPEKQSARPEGSISGVVRRFNRKQRASESCTSLGMIRTEYGAAIEYTGSPTELRGLVMTVCFISGLLSLYYGVDLMLETIGRLDNPDFIDRFMPPIIVVFLLFGAGFLLWGLRLEFFRPVDEPVIFDRRNRKVYRLYRQSRGGIRGLFAAWPMRAVEYPWNVIDAEHIATLTVNTAVAQRHHSLLFIARKSNSDSRVVDGFAVVSGALLGEANVAPFWEHIRRFMEEGGPRIPENESRYSQEVPATLWQSLGAVGPFGPRYFWWWKTSPVLTVFLHLTSPLMLPGFLLWGFFNWLSYKTAFQTQWPLEVMDAIGPAIEPTCPGASPHTL